MNYGHLSAVYFMALDLNTDVLVTAGRDSTARVWNMWTKINVHTLVGHTNTVASVIHQITVPQSRLYCMIMGFRYWKI